jgi:hypothetical protein
MTQETKTAKYQDIYQLKNAPEPVRATLGHTEHQPAPVRLEGQPSVAVLPYVLQDFRDKAKVGLEKYGTRLRTNNGVAQDKHDPDEVLQTLLKFHRQYGTD